jgi:rhamnosyltransferase subunit B
MTLSKQIDFLFVLMGSSGDVLPGVTIARDLLRRGHTATIVTNPYFQSDVERHGLGFIPIGDISNYERLTNHPDLWKPMKGTAFLLADPGFASLTSKMLSITDDWMAGRPQGTFAVVASSLALAPRILRDHRSFPLASLHLSPSVFRSVEQPPVIALGGLIPWLHKSFPRRFRDLVDRFLVDPMMEKQLGPLRKGLGLPKIKNWMTHWWHSPDLVVALFPEWFASPGDLPSQAKQFPFLLAGNDAPLPQDLDAFLKAGSSPVVVTLGSAMAQAGVVFEETARAARELGKRVVLLTRHPEQLSQPMGGKVPEGTLVCRWAPLSGLFERACLVAHHGGIGTTAQAIAAGVPQLILPFAHDQPDNAHIIKSLNLGDFHDPHRIRFGRLKGQIQGILTSESVANACQEARNNQKGFDEKCPASEALVEMVRNFRL